ncbi:hypothetical protein ACSU1N_04950 [Thermogladius sp. 4427co]|uniref:hypothetical protein n=1 Tax=Thermogladius sp. 4427co TaxID=3450718 RepID=UPI003F78D01B
MKKELKQALILLNKLLEDEESFFSMEYLNSEGRKLFEEAARIILAVAPFMKKRIVKTRKKADIYTIRVLRDDLRDLLNKVEGE